jgi:hypothetical protein
VPKGVYLAVDAPVPERDDIVAAIESCLDRLRTAYVDLLYVHWPAGSYDPTTTLETFQELRGAGKTKQPPKPDFFENARYFSEEIDCLAVGFSKFDTQCLEREHRSAGEPATSFGADEFVWILDSVFSFRNAFSGEETKFRCQAILSLCFLQG